MKREGFWVLSLEMSVVPILMFIFVISESKYVGTGIISFSEVYP